MKLRNYVFLCLVLVLISACQKDIDENVSDDKRQAATVPEEKALDQATLDQQAADEASLLAAAKAAGVSDDEALAAKAEFDKIYNETADKMSEAEAERIARDKQFKDDACITNCQDD